MSVLAGLRSQLANVRAFHAFFPPRRVLRDAARLPLDYLLRGGLRPFPLVVDLNPTNRCNLECAFCYNRDNHAEPANELGFDELGALVREAAPFGGGFFLSGGEPLVRPDVVPLVERMAASGLAVGLVSNGALLDRETVDRLLAGGCAHFVISLHGPRAVHDAITGRDGSYDLAMAAVRRLAERVPPPGPMVNCVVSAKGMPTLETFLDEMTAVHNVVVRLAHTSFVTADEAAVHVEEWQRRLGDLPCTLLDFSDEVDPEAFAKLPALLRKPRFRTLLTRPVLSDDEVRRWYRPGFTHRRRCAFVRHSTVVNADGTVFPCQYYATPMGNVRQNSLADIWQSERYRQFREAIRTRLLPACFRCCKL